MNCIHFIQISVETLFYLKAICSISLLIGHPKSGWNHSNSPITDRVSDFKLFDRLSWWSNYSQLTFSVFQGPIRQNSRGSYSNFARLNGNKLRSSQKLFYNFWNKFANFRKLVLSQLCVQQFGRIYIATGGYTTYLLSQARYAR